MDIADVAAEHMEKGEAGLIARSRQPEAPKATGFCLFCSEPVPEQHRWCDKDCQDDWVRLTRSMK